MTTFDFSDYQQQLHGRLVPVLRKAKKSADLAAIMAEIHAQVEHDLENGLTADDHRRLACTAGCSRCCCVNVSILMPEAVTIARYLQRGYDPLRLAQLCQQMQTLVVAISSLDDEERIAVRRNCSFLDPHGLCIIYPVRPLLCRAVTSVDADDCRAALTMAALGEQPAVIMNLFQRNLMTVAYQGLAAALEQAGQNGAGHELTAAVLQQLQGVAADLEH